MNEELKCNQCLTNYQFTAKGKPPGLYCPKCNPHLFNSSMDIDANEQGLRFNGGKPKLSMILEARHALADAAKVLEFGAVKYARGNWHKGLSHTEICDSMLRHLSAYLAGESIDPESGCTHTGHILVNALFLAEMIHTKPEMDDRSDELKG